MAGSGAGGGGVGETKVIYHLDEEETPYLVKIPVPAERITLGDFKSVLQRPAGAKYFFKSMDQDFGVVKEEISDDNARLPCFNGRVVSWLDWPPLPHSPIVLTVAKCWDPSPQAYFTLPRNEPIQPIDPAAWVSHSAALTGTFPAYPGSSSMSTITSGSSLPDGCEGRGLSIHTDMASVTKAMAAPESGLEVRDRMWLKITIPNAFLGSDVVDWLYHHVEGFPERREARKYASGLLKAGLIRHTVNKITFSEQCYYVFGDLSGGCESWLHPYGPPPGMALPYNPMMVVMMPPPPPPVPPAVQPPGAPPVRDLGSVPPELTASRQSFHMAMGNPSEFFVDVM
ncbi:Segment polarity protein dishevelled DVL-2, partial [Eschrichtius robustus]|nr:Segment polarity protein dishevelled DVL-2 [Eschrichtius robustus]